MPEPTTTALLLDYFDEFVNDRDTDAFRRKVYARYNEGTLARMVHSGDVPSRRAAILALGLVGSISANPVVAGALSDSDEVVRSLAESALWAIWFRADTPENNATLEQVRSLLSSEHPTDAIAVASRLIQRAPNFAEAYNQRAIGYFFLGRYEDSAVDCRRVLDRNPYHIGALSGLGNCFIEMGRRTEAIDTLRRALQLQPFDGDLRATIQALESGAG